ncbi:peroxidase 47 [Brassica napus]|uniref:peroxidase 47 n=1 Tax=Brassica napus TaxID=3708 RepID=UPI002079871F|nr:peroxidase 47 [Brassica napus]
MKNNKMVRAKLLRVIMVIHAIIGLPYTVMGLSMSYYMMSCPAAEQIVTNTVNNALRADPTLAAGLIRMLFHDCFIEGCDASVLLDSTKDNTAEKDSPANLSLRGYEIIDDAKKKIEATCPGVVSCADIIAMAARDAVFAANGPYYQIPKGRFDGKRSKIEDTRNLPSPFLNASQLIQTFGQRGFTPQDVVALSGAHSLGVARCSSFKARLTTPDSSMDSSFVNTLTKTCSAGDDAEQPFDATRNNFDNAYFNALQRKSGVLFSDQTLFNTPATRNIVNGYAFNQAKFFFDFQMAMQKMSNLDVKLGSQGEVRKNCRILN